MHEFIKKYWYIFVAALTTVIVIVISIFSKDAVSEYFVKPENDLSKEKEEIAKLKGKKEVISEELEEVYIDIEETEEYLERADVKIEEDRSEVSDMSPEEKLDKFEDLGY